LLADFPSGKSRTSTRRRRSPRTLVQGPDIRFTSACRYRSIRSVAPRLDRICLSGTRGPRRVSATSGYSAPRGAGNEDRVRCGSG
jgi:hypothetical protein